jgi:putative transposase
MSRKSRAKPASTFRYFHSSPELIREVVMLYVRFPLSLRNVEDLLFERGYDLCHETVRLWWNRFGPMFAPTSGAGAFHGCAVSATGSGTSTKCT